MIWIAFLVLVTSAAGGGAEPKSVDELDRFHPAANGDAWAYQVTEEGKLRLQDVVVHRAETSNRVTFETVTGSRVLRYELSRTDEAWYLRSIEGRLPIIRIPVSRTFRPPLPFLKIPQDESSIRWEWTGQSEGWGGRISGVVFEASRHSDLGGIDRVTVTAHWLDGQEVVESYTAVYEAGKGLVAQESKNYEKHLVSNPTESNEGRGALGPATDDSGAKETE